VRKEKATKQPITLKKRGTRKRQIKGDRNQKEGEDIANQKKVLRSHILEKRREATGEKSSENIKTLKNRIKKRRRGKKKEGIRNEGCTS